MEGTRFAYRAKLIFAKNNYLKRTYFFLPYLFLVGIAGAVLSSCTTIDLYEKNITLPGHSWSSAFKPTFSFTITDTTASYQLFLVFRHTEKYNYNNIWINLYSQPPGDTVHKARFELQLATNDKGWLGTGMDDIYEHRILISPEDENSYFRKKGNYTFTVEQIMREDPLKNVLSVGLRIEKQQ